MLGSAIGLSSRVRDGGQASPPGWTGETPVLHSRIDSSEGGVSIPGTILNPDWRAEEPECAANLIFQKALVGKMQPYLAIGK